MLAANPQAVICNRIFELNMENQPATLNGISRVGFVEGVRDATGRRRFEGFFYSDKPAPDRDPSIFKGTVSDAGNRQVLEFEVIVTRSTMDSSGSFSASLVAMSNPFKSD